MAFETWLLLKLQWMLSANFKPKSTAVASRGFLATARLSCSHIVLLGANKRWIMMVRMMMMMTYCWCNGWTQLGDAQRVALHRTQSHAWYNIQIVTGVEVNIENCFPEVAEILPEAKSQGQYVPNWGETLSNIDRWQQSLFVLLYVTVSCTNVPASEQIQRQQPYIQWQSSSVG